MKNDGSEKEKLIHTKDIVIIVLSLIALILLIVILLISRARSRKIAESLRKDSQITSEEVVLDHTARMENKLLITEVSADGWIEIYNEGTDEIDISGMQILVAGENVANVKDGTKIEPESYYVLQLDKLLTNEKYNTIEMIHENSMFKKAITYPELSSGQSYGVADIKNNIWGYITPSKGTENSIEGVEYVNIDGIDFSAPGGFYDDTFNLELKCDEGNKIYYTVDGTRPSTDSQLYEDYIKISNRSGSNYVYARMAMSNSGYIPKSIDSGMIIRAILVDSAGNVKNEVVQSYFIGLSNDSSYQNIPVISIVTDPENLFDYETGIYISGKTREDALIQKIATDNAANYLNNWKKPARIEYYQATKNISYSTDAEMSVIIDSYSGSSQKGLRFKVGEDDKLYSTTTDLNDYISSDGNLFLTTNYEDNTLKVRNKIVEALSKGLSTRMQEGYPCSVFINGEYWGLYNIKVNFDQKYYLRNYGVSEEIISHVGQLYNPKHKEFLNFIESSDLSQPENYEKVKNLMDIDNYIEYICLNIFVGNSDFSPSYGRTWRTVEDFGGEYSDGRWRFVSGDMSTTLHYSALETPTINTWLQPGIQGDLMFQSLLMNKEFCSSLEAKMEKLVAEDFSEENWNSEIDAIEELMVKPCLTSYARYSGGLSNNAYSASIDKIKEFLINRGDYILKYTRELTEKGGDLDKARELMQAQEEMNTDNSDDQENTDNTVDQESMDGTVEQESTDNTEKLDEPDNSELLVEDGDMTETEYSDGNEIDNGIMDLQD